MFLLPTTPHPRGVLSKIRRQRDHKNNMQRKHDVTEIENLRNFGFTLDHTLLTQYHAPESSPNGECEIIQLKKTALRQNVPERNNQLQV